MCVYIYAWYVHTVERAQLFCHSTHTHTHAHARAHEHEHTHKYIHMRTLPNHVHPCQDLHTSAMQCVQIVCSSFACMCMVRAYSKNERTIL